MSIIFLVRLLGSMTLDLKCHAYFISRAHQAPDQIFAGDNPTSPISVKIATSLIRTFGSAFFSTSVGSACVTPAIPGSELTERLRRMPLFFSTISATCGATVAPVFFMNLNASSALSRTLRSGSLSRSPDFNDAHAEKGRRRIPRRPLNASSATPGIPGRIRRMRIADQARERSRRAAVRLHKLRSRETIA
jgi:hypothetical protein